MVQLNKYLKELGIDEKSWLFNKEKKINYGMRLFIKYYNHL